MLDNCVKVSSYPKNSSVREHSYIESLKQDVRQLNKQITLFVNTVETSLAQAGIDTFNKFKELFIHFYETVVFEHIKKGDAIEITDGKIFMCKQTILYNRREIRKA